MHGRKKTLMHPALMLKNACFLKLQLEPWSFLIDRFMLSEASKKEFSTAGTATKSSVIIRRTRGWKRRENKQNQRPAVNTHVSLAARRPSGLTSISCIGSSAKRTPSIVTLHHFTVRATGITHSLTSCGLSHKHVSNWNTLDLIGSYFVAHLLSAASKTAGHLNVGAKSTFCFAGSQLYLRMEVFSSRFRTGQETVVRFQTGSQCPMASMP